MQFKDDIFFCKMRKLYVHIGKHRSGTVFLEKKVFKNLNEVNYIDVRDKYWKYYRYFFKIADTVMTEKDFNAIKSFLNEKASKEKNLISYEGFSGDDYFRLRSKSVSDVLRDVRKLIDGFDFKIIVVLREQSSLIASLYKRYICKGGYKDIYNFVKDEIHLSDLNHYNYTKELEEVFGKDNIYILLYENFLSDDTANKKTETVKNLLKFIGERHIPKLDITKKPRTKLGKLKSRVVNKGYEEFQIRISRLINPFFKSGFNPNGLIPAIPIPIFSGGFRFEFEFIPKLILMNRFFEAISPKYEMPKDLKRKINRYYLGSNKKLNQKNVDWKDIEEDINDLERDVQAVAADDQKLKEGLDKIEKNVVFAVQEFNEDKLKRRQRARSTAQHGSPRGFMAEGREPERTIPRHLRTRSYDRTTAKRQAERDIAAGVAEYYEKQGR
mgnify:CR=1 FL=1